MRKFYCLIICFITVSASAQNNIQIHPDQKVIGVMFSDNNPILITEDGYYQIRKNDPYLDYYKEIYQDSTIQNPNLEIKDDFSISILPFVSLEGEQKNVQYLNNTLIFGQIFQFSDNGGYLLSEKGIEILDSLKLSYSKLFK